MTTLLHVADAVLVALRDACDRAHWRMRERMAMRRRGQRDRRVA